MIAVDHEPDFPERLDVALREWQLAECSNPLPQIASKPARSASFAAMGLWAAIAWVSVGEASLARKASVRVMEICQANPNRLWHS
jgi:hypothetical protein